MQKFTYSQISVLCMRKGEMNEPEIKLTKRWNDYLEQYQESARRLIENIFSSYSTLFPCKKDEQDRARIRVNGFDKKQGEN